MRKQKNIKLLPKKEIQSKTYFFEKSVLKQIFFIIIVFLLQIQITYAQNNEKTDNCDYVYARLLGEEDSKLSGIDLYQVEWLVAFYTQTDCVPAWYSVDNSFAKADEVREILSNYVDADYGFHLSEIEALYAEIQTFSLPMGLFDYDETTEFDMLLSDAALQLAYNLAIKNPTNDNNLEGTLIVALQNAISENRITAFYEDLNEGVWQSISEKNKAVVKNNYTQSDTIDTAPTVVKDEYLKQIFDTKKIENISILNEKLYLPKQTKEFYQKRSFSLAWQNKENEIANLVQAIAKAEEEGLRKADYHFERLNAIYLIDNKIDVDARTAVEQDVLLTDAVLRYASHLFWGKLNPEEIPFEWNIQREEKNMASALQTALDEKNILNFFEKQKPQHRYYQDLKQALAFLRAEKKEEGENVVIEGEILRLGMTDERVKQLRKKLKIEEEYNNYNYRIFGLPTDSTFVTIDTLFSLGEAVATTDTSTVDELVSLIDVMIKQVKIDTLNRDNIIYYKKNDFNPMFFDTLVQQAVAQFQKRNKLKVDGIVGSQTFNAINKTFMEKIEQIEINLERWRWLPNDFGENYLLVNIPSFMLYIFEQKDSLTLEKRIVVGKNATQTPIFSELVQYLDLNPYWTLPYSIATAEMLPRLKRNNRYLISKNMELFAGGKKINSANVNWAEVNRSNFRYTIRQKPGKNNALGEVKFLFPNSYNVYVHDTPSKSLFANYERAYSHGCVRLENPMELAKYLLRDSPKWTAEKLEKQLKKRKNKRIILDEPVPIYIIYLTAVSDKNGQIIYGNDIYNHDEALMNVFYQK